MQYSSQTFRFNDLNDDRNLRKIADKIKGKEPIEEYINFFKHLYKFPKCLTDIPIDEDAWFYNPAESEVESVVSDAYQRVLEILRMMKTKRSF